MITKNKKVGDFDNVTIFHISKIEVRTKRVGIESEIAIANNIDEDKSEEAFDDTLQRIDLFGGKSIVDSICFIKFIISCFRFASSSSVFRMHTFVLCAIRPN